MSFSKFVLLRNVPFINVLLRSNIIKTAWKKLTTSYNSMSLESQVFEIYSNFSIVNLKIKSLIHFHLMHSFTSLTIFSKFHKTSRQDISKLLFGKFQKWRLLEFTQQLKCNFKHFVPLVYLYRFYNKYLNHLNHDLHQELKM